MSKKFHVKNKFWVQKSFGSKKLDPRKILVRKIFGKKINLGSKNVLPLSKPFTKFLVGGVGGGGRWIDNERSVHINQGWMDV